ncbi:DUF2478 domain-containing protein [Shimia marina]|uniref:ABC-type molybdate transport system, ATPase component n=2 Tax=Shimia marina TaxID=321267 RepID=A0A0P1ETX3_9RHOB|nr:DUF2478 domain-containing protein [Shimia marina]CUH53971.1 ABC-type molybdate transport system, ATPase component [Shimia marina]SFE17954.1 Protein of unknown function [Shimia marina]
MMKIAYTMAHRRGELDLLLSELAARLEQRDIKTRGIVQTNTGCDTDKRCDMDVQVLPDGPVIRISQDLGKEARGCRLDPDAMATAITEVSQTLNKPYDVFLLNKFGKQEAEGRGFRDLLAEALDSGATVIAGTNPLNAEVFEEFAGGMATQVPANIDDLLAWYDAVNAS